MGMPAVTTIVARGIRHLRAGGVALVCGGGDEGEWQEHRGTAVTGVRSGRGLQSAGRMRERSV